MAATVQHDPMRVQQAKRKQEKLRTPENGGPPPNRKYNSLPARQNLENIKDASKIQQPATAVRPQFPGRARVYTVSNGKPFGAPLPPQNFHYATLPRNYVAQGPRAPPQSFRNINGYQGKAAQIRTQSQPRPVPVTLVPLRSRPEYRSLPSGYSRPPPVPNHAPTAQHPVTVQRRYVKNTPQSLGQSKPRPNINPPVGGIKVVMVPANPYMFYRQERAPHERFSLYRPKSIQGHFRPDNVRFMGSIKEEKIIWKEAKQNLEDEDLISRIAMNKPPHVIVVDPPVSKPHRAATITIHGKPQHQENGLDGESEAEPVIIDYVSEKDEHKKSDYLYSTQISVHDSNSPFSGLNESDVMHRRQRKPSDGSVKEMPPNQKND